MALRHLFASVHLKADKNASFSSRIMDQKCKWIILHSLTLSNKTLSTMRRFLPLIQAAQVTSKSCTLLWSKPKFYIGLKKEAMSCPSKKAFFLCWHFQMTLWNCICQTWPTLRQTCLSAPVESDADVKLSNAIKGLNRGGEECSKI